MAMNFNQNVTLDGHIDWSTSDEKFNWHLVYIVDSDTRPQTTTTIKQVKQTW